MSVFNAVLDPVKTDIFYKKAYLIPIVFDEKPVFAVFGRFWPILDPFWTHFGHLVKTEKSVKNPLPNLMESVKIGKTRKTRKTLKNTKIRQNVTEKPDTWESVNFDVFSWNFMIFCQKPLSLAGDSGQNVTSPVR